MTTLKHCYPTRCTTLKLPPGLGDYLRGGIALAHHALERGWGFELDFSGHPIGKFLDPTASAEASQAPIDEFFDERASLVYGWMDRLQEGQVGRTCTNLLPHESRITPRVREAMQANLRLNPAILATAQDTKSAIAGDQPMAVLHVRVADADFRSLQTTQPALCAAIESRVLPTWGRRVAVLSNNPGLRAALCERYGFRLIEAEAVHLGACDVNDQAVRDTLVDFALICSASQVFSHSAYGWKSGFSYWASAIHGIQFDSLRAEHTEVTPVWKQRLKTALWSLESR
ncbi:hypothetical protein [Roseateles paludis]|uniref:Uncharacterized protein n=1 Tax=Roseateles paludis TaxID=3145238 RepID=A0ABV0G011_9BURK